MKPTRREPLKSFFCLLAFLIAGTLPGLAQAQPIQTNLKVCVTDEGGSKVADKGLVITLFNARHKIASPRDDCFESGPVALDIDKTYFVVAVKENRMSFSEVKLSAGDNKKTKQIDLKLAVTKVADAGRPDVEICAEDEANQRVSVVAPSPPSGGQDFIVETPRTAGCARVRFGAAPEYQLNLTARRAAGDSGGSGGERLPWLLILSIIVLSIIVLALTLGNFFAARKAVSAQRVYPGREAIEALQERMESMSQDLGYIKTKIDEWEKDEPPAPRTAPLTAGKEAEVSTGAAVLTRGPDPVPAPGLSHEPPPQPGTPPIATSELARRGAEARRRYNDFISGRQVSHFYLMPIGSSSPNQMVEEAKVELREQEHGAYIAFPTSGNDQEAAEAWVFPLPGYIFTAETFSAVFPDLTAQAYLSGDFEPRRAISSEPKLWKVE